MQFLLWTSAPHPNGFRPEQPASLAGGTGSPAGGKTQLHSLADPQQLGGYPGAFGTQPLPQRVVRSPPLRPCRALLPRTISLKREGKAILCYFYTYPET